ncbi:MAG: flagellar assembly protein FliH [Deltaproteobacteria bacterium]|jgi:flagellar assembly protein FliH|nr:flagellar assembly protein FliH [Deltaproteobacteria bacterium]
MSGEDPQNNQEESKPKWGRIFMGDRISELGDVESVRSRAWDAKDEADYLDRVRARATEKAKEILATAETDAAAIRREAAEAGYAEGLKQAEAELEELRSSMGSAVSGVLNSLQSSGPALSRAWRDDLAALVRLSVEKILGITLEREKSKVLEGLYLQAVKTLENNRRIVVRVNPEDEAAISDIIGMGLVGQPELEQWSVKADASISPGGLILESDFSLADNTLESRKAAVESVLAGLHLPE